MKKEKDIFDKIMALPLLRIFQPLYKKYKSVLLYLFFGALTTLVSILSFYIAGTTVGINEHAANVISWILAVTFAFVTNRIWVFDARCDTKKEFLSQMRDFYVGRLATLGVEELILLVFVTLMKLNKNVIKIIAQLAILVLNYLVSKLFVFKNKSDGK